VGAGTRPTLPDRSPRRRRPHCRRLGRHTSPLRSSLRARRNKPVISGRFLTRDHRLVVKQMRRAAGRPATRPRRHRRARPCRAGGW
jgi:hypothetical protein